MSEEIIIINNEPFYRIPNGTSYDYAPIPKEFKPYFEKIQQENSQLKDRINQTKNTIETTISIIKQQPSSDKELDLYFINQLERYLNLLKGDKE